MKISTAKLKRWLNLLLVVGLIYGAFKILLPEVYRFNPQYLVETSVLKNKGFNNAVQEVISPKHNIKAYFLEEHSNPIVSVSFVFQNSGAAYEPAGKIGIGQLLCEMLFKGAGRYDMDAYNNILEQNAIGLSFYNNDDEFFGRVKFIVKDKNTAAQMVNVALTAPKLPAKYIMQGKKDLESAYYRQQEQADNYLAVEAAKALYGKHPYSQSGGTPRTLRSLTEKDLRTFMKQYLALDNLAVGISGDLSATEAGELLDKMFAGLPPHRQGKELASAQLNLQQPEIKISRSGLPQIAGMFAAQGTPWLSEDFYPLTLALEIFSGSGLSSRLQKTAREERGLTYGVYGSLFNLDKADIIYGRFSTTPENFEELVRLIEDEWLKMGEFGVTEEELDKVKNYLTASEPLRYANISSLARTLSFLQKKNSGLDFLQKRNTYIANVTLEQVNAAAKKYFTKDNLYFAAIGNFEK